MNRNGTLSIHAIYSQFLEDFPLCQQKIIFQVSYNVDVLSARGVLHS